MKVALQQGSRYGWREALIFPLEYFDAAPAPPSGGIVGDDTPGADTFPTSGNRAILSKFTMPANGTAVMGYLRFDVTSAAGTNAKFLCYSDDTGSTESLLYAAPVGQAVPAAGGVLAFVISIPGLLAGQDVWIGGVTDSFQAKWQAANTGGLTRSEGSEGMSYASPPATWTQSGTGTAKVNAWMDYVTADGPAPGLLKCWDGGAWVAKPLKAWTGAEWKQGVLKYWDSTAWVPANSD